MLFRLAAAVLIALGGIGCAGSQSTATHGDGALAGPWLMTISPTMDLGVGEIRTVLFFEPEQDGAFEAHSRSGAVGDLVGGFKGFLAGVMGGEAYSRGALLHVYDGALTPQDGATSVAGRLMAQGFGSVSMRGTLADGRMTGTLNGQEAGTVVARFSATPYRGSLPLADYANLVPDLRREIAARYFDPRELAERRWTRFWPELERRMARAQDDFEAIAQFQLAASAVGVSHFGLQRAEPSGADDDRPSADTDAEPAGVTFARRPDGVAVLTCEVFQIDQAEPVIERAFAEMAATPPEALVLDLRQCLGGDFSSMLVAAHLVRTPEAGGLFLSSRWWAEHAAAPSPDAWPALQALVETDLDAFFARLDEHGALVARVEPAAPRYDGLVYVLTSGRTASAAEPLAHLLKATGRATLVGAPTAGAMLASRQFPVEGGWLLRIPVADYYTAEGARLEGEGVLPDVLVEPDEALDAALRLDR